MQKLMQELFSKYSAAKIMYRLVVLVLIFVPLYMKFPLLGVTNTFVSIRLEDILIFLTFLSWLVYMFRTKKMRALLKTDIFFSLIVFFLIGAFSVISAVILTKTVHWNLGFLHFARRFELMIFMPIVYTVIKSGKYRRKFVGLLFLVSLAVNIYALGQKWMHFPAVSTTNSVLSKGKVYYLGGSDRVISTFAGHYDLAIFEMTVILLGVPLVVYSLKKKDRFAALFLILNSVFSFVILTLTAARFSFVAVFVGLVISLLLIGRKGYWLVLLVIFAAMVVYPSQLRNRLWATIKVNLLGNYNQFSSASYDQQFKGTLNIPTLPATNEEKNSVNQIPDIAPGEPIGSVDLGVYRSFAIRINVEWPRALRAFYKNPFFGTGYSSLGLATDNDYLRSLGETGLLGTTAFVFLLYLVFKNIWINFKASGGFSRYLLAGIISMYLAFLANGVFIDVFEASKTATIFWMLMGLGLSKT
jgi:hypothetical protein